MYKGCWSLLRNIGLIITVCALLMANNAVQAEGQMESQYSGIWDELNGLPSTQGISQAVYRYWTGATEAQSRRLIEHTRTFSPYNYLYYSTEKMRPLGGYDASLIFVSEPYKELDYFESDLEYADRTLGSREQLSAKDIFEFVPIARGALVFFTNRRNPVKHIKVEQLRNIYTGDITNWAEVGGDNRPIQPFQRPWDTESQKMFEKKVLRGLDSKNSPTEWFEDDRGEEYEIFSAYNNSSGALGYTMYFYAEDQYGHDEINLLALDGISPNRHTIMNETYPLTVLYYAVFPKELPQEHPVRKLVAWLCTEEGQKVIQNAGFIPLVEVPGEFNWPQLFPLKATRQSCGTAALHNRDGEISRFAISELIRGENLHNTLGWVEGVGLSVHLSYYPLIEHKVNEWLNEMQVQLGAMQPNHAEKKDRMEEYAIVNGDLLSIIIKVKSGTDMVIRTAVFDLKGGKQLQLSDLFFEGFNYIEYINCELLRDSFREESAELGDFAMSEKYFLRPFSGFPNDYAFFIVADSKLGIVFQGDNHFVQVPQSSAALPIANVTLKKDISPWGN